MSNATTQAPAAASAPKAPVGIKSPQAFFYREEESQEIKSVPAATVYSCIVNDPDENASLRNISTEDLKMSHEDVAKRLVLANVRTFPNHAEVPGEFSDFNLEHENNAAHAFVSGHFQIKAELDGKAELEKKAKAQKKVDDAKAKAEKDQEYQKNSTDFAATILKAVNKNASTNKKLSENIVSKITAGLPASIQHHAGMGLVVGEGATQADVATALSAAILVMDSVKQADGAAQFAIGDLLNGAVAAGVYPKKGDAAKHIQNILKENLKRPMDIGSIQAYALMAERTPVAKRVMGVRTSNYLYISKLTAPRVKGQTPEELQKIEQKILEFRDELINEVNSGEIQGQALAKKIEEFKKENGFAKEKESHDSTIIALLKRYFWATFLLTLADKNGSIKVVRGKGKAKANHTYTEEEISEIRDSAWEEVVQLQVGKVGGYDLKALACGLIDVGGGKEEIYRMADPFFVPADKTAEPAEPQQQEGLTEVEGEDSSGADNVLDGDFRPKTDEQEAEDAADI